MAGQYDLTSKMIPFLDQHLVFPLLEFLEINELFYTPSSLLQARYELSLKTNMVDFIDKLHGELEDAGVAPASIELPKKPEEILEQLEAAQSEARKVLDVIENPDVVAALRQDKLQNLQFLKDNYSMTPEIIQTLYKLGQFQYSCGNYGGTADMLYHYRVLSTDDNLGLSALWGKLASEILVGALSQTSCPWILRYLTAAVITNKRRKTLVKDLIRIIEHEGLVEWWEFIQNARCFISETYCRIHQKIDVAELSQTLNMSPDEGEKWIVNLIRDTRVDAKIDFKENTVLMNTNTASVYQLIIERTKGLSFRSQVLATSIDKRETVLAKTGGYQEKTTPHASTEAA
ncbi:eukaryotic translation initiation factor 3 subunit E [Modicella reniformis]|uniref:Eukaryotic translation initiation factor 3 subunit E n=1 Tax=Modicella reniformis TaxID=1440133 RepID=A0A9P6M9B1_9FUNG|nr:eukaryotic translation initiation factor 3 subunit E [Modicella reniformis]